MRRMQKRYFQERDKLSLAAAKQAEKEVDEALSLAEAREKNEPRLF